MTTEQWKLEPHEYLDPFLKGVMERHPGEWAIEKAHHYNVVAKDGSLVARYPLFPVGKKCAEDLLAHARFLATGGKPPEQQAHVAEVIRTQLVKHHPGPWRTDFTVEEGCYVRSAADIILVRFPAEERGLRLAERLFGFAIALGVYIDSPPPPPISHL